eukprot:scaffold106428_cov18-Prasinocladus_malaysianus.AAC.1
MTWPGFGSDGLAFSVAVRIPKVSGSNRSQKGLLIQVDLRSRHDTYQDQNDGNRLVMDRRRRALACRPFSGHAFHRDVSRLG